MKKTIFFAVALGLAAGGASLFSAEAPAQTEQQKREAESKQKEFEKKMDERLDQLEKELGEMKQKAEKMSGKAKEELNNQIELLQSKKGVLREQLAHLHSAWQDLESGIASAMADLEKTYRKISEKNQKENHPK